MRVPRLLTIIVFLLIAFIYAPLAVSVLFAFNEGSSLTLPFEGVSLRWFRLLTVDPAFARSIKNSAIVAASTAGLAAITGTAAAYVFVRCRSRAMRVLEAASQLPVMLPPLLIGVAMLATIGTFGFSLSLTTVTLGHLVTVIPYVIVVVIARMRGIDVALEEAARDLGAGSHETMRRIVLPLLAPAILGSAVLAFAFSFDETLVTNFTVGSEPTLPLFVMSRMRRTIDPSVNAVATILLILPWAVLLLGGLVIVGRSRSIGLSLKKV
jgi:spermidine/putrescine transport system permease protein